MSVNLEIDDSEVIDFQKDLQFFQRRIPDIIDQAFEQSAEDFRDLVLEQVKANSFYGFQTPDNRGPGPAMATERAWIIENRGQFNYMVRPRPQVDDRAYWLNVGTDPHVVKGEDENLMKFRNQNGEVIYTAYRDGVDESRYFDRAIAAFRQLEILEENVDEAIARHVRKHMN